MGRKYKIISGDGHVETPPDGWLKYVPEQYRDRAPRLIRLPGGSDGWLVEGQPMLHNGQNIKGRGPVKFANASYFNEDGSRREGAGDAVQRLHEQDIDGIDGEVLFAPVFVARFIESISDKAVYRSIVQAYNTWLATDYCSVAPDRLIGNALMPVSGIDDSARRAEAGQGARVPQHPAAAVPERFRARPSPRTTSSGPCRSSWAWPCHPTSASAARYGGATPVPTRRSGRRRRRCRSTRRWRRRATLAQLIVHGVYDRFPEIQFYFAELNCAYIPGMLYYMDRNYHEFNDWFQVSLKKEPSEYILEHTLFGMVRDAPVLQDGPPRAAGAVRVGQRLPPLGGDLPDLEPAGQGDVRGDRRGSEAQDPGRDDRRPSRPRSQRRHHRDAAVVASLSRPLRLARACCRLRPVPPDGQPTAVAAARTSGPRRWPRP